MPADEAQNDKTPESSATMAPSGTHTPNAESDKPETEDAKALTQKDTAKVANSEATGDASTSGNPSVEKPKDKNTEPSTYLCGSIFDMDDTASVKRLWPNGQVLTYRFVDGQPNQHAKVTQAIPEWSRYANVTFKLVDKSSKSIIAISFKDTWRCWGYIGTDVQSATDSPLTMALGAVSDSLTTTHGERAVILHQFGHALGLVHEHMCPSETDAVALKQDLISEHYSSRYDGTSIEGHFDVYANESVTNYDVPDLSSVMVYFMSGKFNEGNLTIEPNAMLSPLDKAFMVINYPRSRVHSQASEWTLRHALATANIDDDTSRAIREEHDITKRRVLFADYLSAARQKLAAPLVDPAPKIVLDLTLPAVQDALRVFFNDIDGHPGVKEIRADPELIQELEAVLDRLASYHAVREVVQEALPPPPATPVSPGILEFDEDFTNRLVEVVALLHAAVKPQVTGVGDAEVRRVDAVTALCNELALHPAFRRAMKHAIGKDAVSPEHPASPSKSTLVSTTPNLAAANPDDEGKTPDVSAIIAQLKRPGVLQAVRQALVV